MSASYERSGLTDRETYDINGCLSPERIEALIDRTDRLDRATSTEIVSVDEAIAQYPDEGFLDDMKDRIAKVAKRCRGRNKDDLESIIEAMNDLEMMVFYAAEYGIKELRKLEQVLDNAGVGE